MVNPHRVFIIDKIPVAKKGPVVYWMFRDQRVHNNWALLFAAYTLRLKLKKLLLLLYK